MKIMVVDDERIVIESCRRVLEPEGFEVLMVTSAMEALGALETERPSIFIVDIKMPGHDGLYLLRELKERNIRIPVILMSGLNTEDMIAEALTMGASNFIAKPFTPDELLKSVRQTIQKEVPMSKQKVLVIDDEQVILDSVQKILMSENYDVDQCLRGKEGIEKAIHQSYDLVLTDIRMPDICGLIVLLDVKCAKPALPVVIITGYASVRSAVQAMKLGASDYIEKPFSPDELLKAVSSSIHRSTQERPEEQDIIHKEEVLKVLELGAVDFDFRRKLLDHGADAWDDFELTGPEKLAIITGDIAWIEAQIGSLSHDQRIWLEARLSAEIW